VAADDGCCWPKASLFSIELFSITAQVLPACGLLLHNPTPCCWSCSRCLMQLLSGAAAKAMPSERASPFAYFARCRGSCVYTGPMSILVGTLRTKSAARSAALCTAQHGA
jgi:hypothetical protein